MKASSLSKVVAILDAGGQYVDMVQKATERLGYSADVLPLKTPVSKLEGTYKAVIISGSPANPHDTSVPMPDPELWQSALPVLGICFGMQAMAIASGGKAVKSPIREDGRVTTQVDITHPLFQGVKADFTGLFTHGVFVAEVPEGFRVIGEHRLSNGKRAYSALARGNKVGVQFHPEVFDDTPEGYEVFRNFFTRICRLAPDETFQTKRLKSLIKIKQAEIKKKVAGRKVIAFMSGGVDSSVAATLAAAVVDFEAFYIDTGYMRDEDEDVIDFLKKIGMHVKKIDASKTFAKAEMVIDGQKHGPLETTSDPQAKRRLIGKTFIDVQNEIIAKLGLTADKVALLQGTNAADRIESGYSKGDAHTQTIKTHHNLVPEARDLDPIEPLDDLFKDEIRALGAELGMPEDIIWRQPFPGPGLAIRILHAKKDEYEPHSAKEQAEVRDFVNQQAAGLSAALLPVRSVGVGGDERSHLSAVALHGVAPWQVLAGLATDLPAHFREQINRVVYALGDTPLDKLSVTPTEATDDVRAQLRHADRIVFEEMRGSDIMRTITQFPVVLLPLSFGKAGQRSIVLRPVITSTFMTVQAMIPGRDLPEAFVTACTVRILKEVPGISQVFIDLTNKPPATTEWE
jgi:GMP synthase (glutamine-hydrolysing)